MDPLAQVVSRTTGPTWLPAGSTATVVRSAVAPAPTGLVRLLLRADDRVLCLPRADGRLDLPTEPVPPDVADPDGTETVRALSRQLLPAGTALLPVGHVRNEVPTPDAGYAWPVPLCHFTVWAPLTPVAPREPPGSRWVDLGPGSPLAERHWFPLLLR
jgi:hypothetical protein